MQNWSQLMYWPKIKQLFFTGHCIWKSVFFSCSRNRFTYSQQQTFQSFFPIDLFPLPSNFFPLNLVLLNLKQTICYIKSSNLSNTEPYPSLKSQPKRPELWETHRQTLFAEDTEIKTWICVTDWISYIRSIALLFIPKSVSLGKGEI